MQDATEKMKGLLLSVLPAVAASYFGLLAVPFLLLVVCNVMDYVTGLLAAPVRGEARSSYRGFLGIARKIGMWGLVAVAMVMDVLLAYVTEVLHWGLPLPTLTACIASIWLLANELVSILENLGDLGVSVPFLLPLIRWVRRQAEDAAQAGAPPDEKNAKGKEEKEDDVPGMRP